MDHQHMHHDHEQMMQGPHAANDFLTRFLLVTLLLIPLFYAFRTGLKDVEFIFATAIFAVGFIFFQHAYHEIKAKKLGMMTLVSVAVGAGYFFSVAATFISSLGMGFYLEISTLIWVLLFGHFLEAKSSTAAGDALSEVAKLLPKNAHVRHGEHMMDVPLESLKEGDEVIIKPGEKVPADGVIIEGSAQFNESLVTGESRPVNKTKDDRAIAGAINLDSVVTLKLDRVGEHSTIGQIQNLIKNARSTKPSAQKLADQAASWLTIAALVIALLTIIVWITLGQTFATALTFAITVLVIACPHALGLAIPTVTTIATRLAVKHGIFIKDLGKLEVVKKADYVVFDKTGTLTEGKFGVIKFKPKTLAIAASLEQYSSHLIGQAIVAKALKENISLLPVTDFKNHAGKGVSGVIAGTRYFVGKVGTSSSPHTIVDVARGEEVLGRVELDDEIKPSAKKAISNLHALGLKVAMLTGDQEEVAKNVAAELEIDSYFAEVLPEQKYMHVKSLQDRGAVVIMVGDGVNDAPALTQANVGVAIGAGTDVAVEAGDVVLTHSDPAAVVSLVKLSRRVYAKMQQNLWWALGYNIVAIPAAAGVFIPWGFTLSPQMGAIAMAASSVIVVLNALSLLLTK